MILILQVICGCLLLQLLFVLWNVRQLPKLGAIQFKGKSPVMLNSPKKSPQLSILIPARDEADHIGPCLQSVLACRSAGWDLEVIVLDDRSSDGTGAIAAAAGADRVKVIPGSGLPEGWLGKSHACAQLAEAANGEWLLFLDADIRLRPDALEAAYITADAQGRGLITGFPQQRTGTWLEKLIVPLMNFTILCHLPVPLVRGSRDPRFVAAHGGFMLIHRDSYALCGGHAGIRSALVDDMALARAVKRSGDIVTLADITDHAEMRMYQNAGQVWNGYRKNIYAGLGRQPLLLLCVLSLYTLLYIVPAGMLVFSGIAGQAMVAAWSLTAMVEGILIKRISDASGRQSRWLCLALPVSIFCLAAIAISSWKGSLPGQGYEWKGRHYQ
ncbi:glycosyltransferase [Paenibacillus sp. sgz500958]|uniref:glycosyltransferase n=1 Tax=Paenibacillus sp. sgz500958 TaxID=3242475 RepID=UPI0036D26E1C